MINARDSVTARSPPFFSLPPLTPSPFPPASFLPSPLSFPTSHILTSSFFEWGKKEQSGDRIMKERSKREREKRKRSHLNQALRLLPMGVLHSFFPFFIELYNFLHSPLLFPSTLPLPPLPIYSLLPTFSGVVACRLVVLSFMSNIHL